MTRRLPPLNSFGPELLQALLEGSRRELRLPATYAEAVRWRQRLNFLRARMQDDKHELAPLVEATKISISWTSEVPVKLTSRGVRIPKDFNAPVELVIAPPDRDLRKLLNDAGVSVDDPSPAALTPQEDADRVIEEFVSRTQKNLPEAKNKS